MMNEKEEIILKHVELAKEYTRLANSDQSLPPEKWKAINQRMEQIQIEIEKLRKIEHSWNEYQEYKEKEKSNLEMLTRDEVAKLLNVHRDTITMLREVGVIQAIKTGKSYMFPQDEIKAFQRNYRGLDVSNKVKALEALKIVQEKATAPTVATIESTTKHFR